MNLFISATNTNVGKTYTSLKLIKSLSKYYKVGVFKPIETGVTDLPLDGEILFNEVKKYNKQLSNLTIDDIVPIQLSLPAAPIVAGEVDFEKIYKSYKKIKSLCDILIIEGAGGLMVPIKENFFMYDFIDHFNAKLILVIQSKLGSINDFLLNKYFLESKNITYIPIINLFDDNFYKITYPYLKKHNIDILQKDLDKITKKIIKELK